MKTLLLCLLCIILLSQSVQASDGKTKHDFGVDYDDKKLVEGEMKSRDLYKMTDKQGLEKQSSLDELESKKREDLLKREQLEKRHDEKISLKNKKHIEPFVRAIQEKLQQNGVLFSESDVPMPTRGEIVDKEAMHKIMGQVERNYEVQKQGLKEKVDGLKNAMDEETAPLYKQMEEIELQIDAIEKPFKDQMKPNVDALKEIGVRKRELEALNKELETQYVAMQPKLEAKELLEQKKRDALGRKDIKIQENDNQQEEIQRQMDLLQYKKVLAGKMKDLFNHLNDVQTAKKNGEGEAFVERLLNVCYHEHEKIGNLYLEKLDKSLRKAREEVGNWTTNLEEKKKSSSPLIPTTLFLKLAALFPSKSSDKANDKLIVETYEELMDKYRQIVPENYKPAKGAPAEHDSPKEELVEDEVDYVEGSQQQ